MSHVHSCCRWCSTERTRERESWSVWTARLKGWKIRRSDDLTFHLPSRSFRIVERTVSASCASHNYLTKAQSRDGNLWKIDKLHQPHSTFVSTWANAWCEYSDVKSEPIQLIYMQILSFPIHSLCKSAFDFPSFSPCFAFLNVVLRSDFGRRNPQKRRAKKHFSIHRVNWEISVDFLSVHPSVGSSCTAACLNRKRNKKSKQRSSFCAMFYFCLLFTPISSSSSSPALKDNDSRRLLLRYWDISAGHFMAKGFLA